MKTHRPVIHMLLALLLLVSQQIGIMHMLSHGGDARYPGRVAATAQAGKVAKAASATILTDASCQECLFFAQMGSVLPEHLRVVRQALPETAVVFFTQSNWHASQSPSPFHSRAPPVVS